MDGAVQSTECWYHKLCAALYSKNPCFIVLLQSSKLLFFRYYHLSDVAFDVPFTL